jgi:hypothetical protein
VITNGVGTEKLKVGETKTNTVLSMYGKHYKFICGIKTNEESSIMYYVERYTYLKNGLSFISHAYPNDRENALIENIIFAKPCEAKTTDGIVLGVDTRESIISKYGMPDSENTYRNISKYGDLKGKTTHTITATLIHYKKKGISFEIDSITGKLTEIEVYRPNGTPYNY